MATLTPAANLAPVGAIGSSEFNGSSAAVDSLTQQLAEDASAVENADVHAESRIRAAARIPHSQLRARSG